MLLCVEEICMDSSSKCVSKALLHGVDFYEGLVFHGDVVLAMFDLKHGPRIRTIMGLNEP